MLTAAVTKKQKPNPQRTTKKRGKMKTLSCFSFLVLYCEGGPQKGQEFWKKNTSMPAETGCALHVLSLPPSPCTSSQPPPWKVIKDKFCILGFWLWAPWWEQKDLLTAQGVLHQRKISTGPPPHSLQQCSRSVSQWGLDYLLRLTFS